MYELDSLTQKSQSAEGMFQSIAAGRGCGPIERRQPMFLYRSKAISQLCRFTFRPIARTQSEER